MTWNHMPHPQQRGSQLGGGAPKEAVQDRSAQKHDEADQQVGGEPRADIDYPATNPTDRRDDITPKLREGDTQSWDDVVQPEGHSRQAPRQEEQARTDPSGEAHRDRDLPLPEGK
jgi:hypothetical protein